MNNRWVKNLFNKRNMRPILKIMGVKRNNRRFMWTSIIGLGIGAAAFKFSGNKNSSRDIRRDSRDSIQNILNKIQTNGNLKPANMAAFAEFAKEIIPDAGKVNNNSNTEDIKFTEINSTEDSIKNE